MPEPEPEPEPHLLRCWFLEAREVNERRKTHQTLAAGDSDAEAQAVGEEGAVGVAPVWEVNNTQQLGEQDHVDQVGAQGPAGGKLLPSVLRGRGQ